jgi:hypothetical protein
MLALFGGGIASGIGFYFAQDGVWNRAEVVAAAIASLQEDVPTMSARAKIERPALLRAEEPIVDAEVIAYYKGMARRAWNDALFRTNDFVRNALAPNGK